MFKRLSLLFVGLALTAACSARPAADAAAPSFTEGQEYVATTTPQRLDPKDGKVEVVEVFSYGCIHCAHYESYAETLQKELPRGVTFRVVPAAFNDAWLPYAQAYYAAQKLGVANQAHAALFKAIHTDHYPIHTIEELAGWYAMNYHVDKTKFIELATKDEGIRQRILADGKLVQAWGIDGTPTIVVDGKYRSNQIKDFDQLNGVVKYLVDRELKGSK
ncbi:thiol:disulfide interchange protein DsbA/DsbL [Luteibacter sp.]|jgi:thiol:disulfide interchange protein DsbA|uniref:thiol:disulfide interchange protein DsbA/DsbL n=1 Tax=Luteibacter sp. TaxID=1886636 RepID=UPI002F420144